MLDACLTWPFITNQPLAFTWPDIFPHSVQFPPSQMRQWQVDRHLAGPPRFQVRARQGEQRRLAAFIDALAELNGVPYLVRDRGGHTFQSASAAFAFLARHQQGSNRQRPHYAADFRAGREVDLWIIPLGF